MIFRNKRVNIWPEVAVTLMCDRPSVLCPRPLWGLPPSPCVQGCPTLATVHCPTLTGVMGLRAVRRSARGSLTRWLLPGPDPEQDLGPRELGEDGGATWRGIS